MNKVLKNVINKTIEREYEKISEDFGQVLKKNPELAKQYYENGEEINIIADKLREIVPKDKQYFIDELEEAWTIAVSAEARLMFKEGLILGVTELNYLSEVGIGIAFI